MHELKNTKSTGKLGNNRLNNNGSQRKDPPIGSPLSRPEINWLQKKENRTKLEGAPGNLWISNKPLWVSELSNASRSTKAVDDRGVSRSVHKEKKYVVVGMRGDQIHHFHGAYRNQAIAASSSFRRGSGGDRPKPSKPREE
ncbi:MAG: hypothetical protein ACFB15_26810 [Cyclobacteriaceae bacterium]